MAIHETVPKFAKSKQARIVARRLRLLGPEMTGKENAKTAAWLAARCGLKPEGTNQVVREAAKILLVEEKIPLISSSSGFYIAATEKQLEDYRESLRSRAQALFRDVQAVNDILQVWRKPNDPQGSLFS
jgi:hypothetical protein